MIGSEYLMGTEFFCSRSSFADVSEADREQNMYETITGSGEYDLAICIEESTKKRLRRETRRRGILYLMVGRCEVPRRPRERWPRR